MNRAIALFVPLYWSALFALLAMKPSAFFGGDLVIPFEEFGSGIAAVPLASWLGLAALSLTAGAVLVSALFLWAFLAALLDRDAANAIVIVRIAFGAAIGLMLVLTVARLGGGGWGKGLSWASLELAALLASYMAMIAERRSAAMRPPQEENPSAARAMAQDAAHRTLLSQLSGRGNTPFGEPG